MTLTTGLRAAAFAAAATMLSSLPLSQSFGAATVPSSSARRYRRQDGLPIAVPSSKRWGTTLASSSPASSGQQQQQQQATELPDSLEDAAIRAAEATAAFAERSGGSLARCRVDFDTSAGDETYTTLKSSTEFMQKFVTALCYATIPEAQKRKQEEIARVVKARKELEALTATKEADDGDEDNLKEDQEGRRDQLMKLISRDGRLDKDSGGGWEGPVARVYFPDEGSAALARRDWASPDAPLVPPCVQFSSCGGVQQSDISKDTLVFFFCPKASESDSVEQILYRTEQEASSTLNLTVFVNPNLVDMGVTGFGMAGRLLRERLIDPLQYTYYLRTLQWGALSRKWPQLFSVWQEDEDADGGYRLIKTMDRLPSNPEVEDIYDIENGMMEGKEGGGVLDQLGDFMNGMMRL